MGTPDFAVTSLRALVEAGWPVVAVVTAPDRPAGRGRHPTAPPVKLYATARGLPVLQPEKLRDPGFLSQLASYGADLQVVVAFRMLPEVVWNGPPLGTFNLHASLLPDYRGAAPINWAIIGGESQTGVTTFFLKHAIDTGDLIYQETTPIRADDDAGTLYARLEQQGAALVVRTVAAIADGTAPRRPQRVPTVEKPAPKIFRQTCQINWQQPSARVVDFVRGLAPQPAAWSVLGAHVYKIFQVRPLPADDNAPLAPGTLRTDHKTYLHVGTADGHVAIESLQPEGKRRMATADFLRGHPL